MYPTYQLRASLTLTLGALALVSASSKAAGTMTGQYLDVSELDPSAPGR